MHMTWINKLNENIEINTSKPNQKTAKFTTI